MNISYKNKTFEWLSDEKQGVNPVNDFYDLSRSNYCFSRKKKFVKIVQHWLSIFLLYELIDILVSEKGRQFVKKKKIGDKKVFVSIFEWQVPLEY